MAAAPRIQEGADASTGSPGGVAAILDVGTGLQGFLESVPEATLVVASTGYIVEANEEAAELFGYTRESLRGLELAALLPESIREAHRRLRADFVRDPHDRSMGRGLEIVAQRRDGSRFPADVELRPREIGGTRVVLTVVRDLSRTDQPGDLLRVRELERRLYLAHLAADDLAGLLMDMMGCLDRMASGAAAADRGALLGSPLEEMRNAADLAHEVVCQLMTYARPQEEQAGGGRSGESE